MRRLDSSLGKPLCFFLTLISRLRSLFLKGSHSLTPEKILFIALSEMGSIILAYPLFSKARKLFPQSLFYFLTFKESSYAVEILGIIDKEKIITIETNRLPAFIFSTLKALWKLRRERIFISLDLELFSRFTAILGFLSGAKHRVGYHRFHNEGLYRGNLMTHRVIFNPYLHISQNFLNLIYALNSKPEEIPLPKKREERNEIILPRWKPTEEREKNLLKKLKEEKEALLKAETIILLNPNASDIIPQRRWPRSNYIKLAKLLLEEKGNWIIITGTESEKNDAQLITQAINSERCLNLAGQTSLAELLDLYCLADVLVTNDSGPAHFSSMTSIQSFVLFGPETPSLYGPLGKNVRIFYSRFACSPCVSAYNQRKSPCRDNQCLKSITVREVYEVIKKYLGEREKPGSKRRIFKDCVKNKLNREG